MFKRSARVGVGADQGERMRGPRGCMNRTMREMHGADLRELFWVHEEVDVFVTWSDRLRVCTPFINRHARSPDNCPKPAWLSYGSEEGCGDHEDAARIISCESFPWGMYAPA